MSQVVNIAAHAKFREHLRPVEGLSEEQHPLPSIEEQRQQIAQHQNATVRTRHIKRACTHCDGCGLFVFRQGVVVPVNFERALREMQPVYICQTCAGAGSVFQEVICQGEAV